MLRIIFGVIQFAVRHALLFLLILAALIAFRYVSKQSEDWKDYWSLFSRQKELSKEWEHLPAALKWKWDVMRKSASDSADRLQKNAKAGARELINAEIQSRDKSINEKEKRIDDLSSLRNLLKPEVYLEKAILHAELDLDKQVRTYAIGLNSGIDSGISSHRMSQDKGHECQRLDAIHRASYQAYLAAERDLASYQEEKGPLIYLPPWAGNVSKKASYRNSLINKVNDDSRNYNTCKKLLNEFNSRLAQGFSFVSFKANEDEYNTSVGEIKQKESELKNHFLTGLARKIDDLRVKDNVFPALLILVSLLVVPTGVRALIYFLVAPLARGRSIVLASEKNILSATSLIAKSAVSQSVMIHPGTELVLHPQYPVISSAGCTTSSRLILNTRYPLSCIAVGLYGLTAVTSETSGEAVVSAGRDSLNEIAIINVGPGGGFSLLPRALIGCLTPIDSPVKISSQWRLFSWQAWLTLQFRFFIFHGPVSLIVKGARGVRVCDAASTCAIDEDATIGFSTNLEYSVCRTESAIAYIRKKKGLLRHRFSGAGVFAYEEAPAASKARSYVGRVGQAMTETVLKVFGI